MAYVQRPFPVDYPGSICVPAHPNNVIDRPNDAKAFFIHTPEEPVDDFESTPAYFARDLTLLNPPRRASTTYYQDSDGDVYQMVPANLGAIANGWSPGPPPGLPWPGWATPGLSLNLQTESVEVEGYARGMHRTCPRGSRQWNGLVKLVEYRTQIKRIPLSRIYIMRHDEVSIYRSDPGTLNVDLLVEDIKALREASDMPSADELTKLFGTWEGTCLEASAYMSRRVKMPTGLIKRLEAIVNLAKSG